MYRYIQKLAPTQHTGLGRTLIALLMAVLIGLADSAVALRPVAATSVKFTAAPTTPSASSYSAVEPRVRTWQPGVVYQQIGSSCVGYSLAAWLDAEPRPVAIHPSGWQIYQFAQTQDGIAKPHDGTTMQAGIKVLVHMGFVGTWESTQDVSKALAFLRTDGPIVLDADFPQEHSVFDSEQNLLWTGKVARHGWLCYGVDGHDRLSCQNSGSSSWNSDEGGRFHMTRAALAKVLAHGLAWLIKKAPGVGS